MTRLAISAAARRDIRQALDHSGRRWGAAQRQRCRTLLGDSLKALPADPEHPASRARDEITPGIRAYHIARPGRPGRHLIVYRVGTDREVQVIRVLHDAMDLERALVLSG